MLFFNSIINLLFWNFLMFFIHLITIICKDNIIPSSLIIGALAGFLTPIYRLIIFEYIYKSSDYISHRKKTENFLNIFNIYNIVMIGFVGFFQFEKTFNYRFLTISDISKCIICFIVIDVFFYLHHKCMHIPFFYSYLGHKEHHILTKPTSYDLFENF